MSNTFKPGDRVVIESPNPEYDGKRGTIKKARREYADVLFDGATNCAISCWNSKLTTEREYDERTQAGR